MRLRPHRRNLVVWSPSAGPVGRYGVLGVTRVARTRRIRRWIRTGGLLTVIGLIGLASDLLFKACNRRLFPWAQLR